MNAIPPFWKIVVTLFFLLVMGAGIAGKAPADIIDPTEPDTTTTTTSTTIPVVVVPQVAIGFGDSITVGYPYVSGPGDGRRIGAWEPLVESALNASNGSWQVLNYGLEGETTYQGLNRIGSVLEGRGGAYILILEGTNDYEWGISYNTTVYNLGAMLDKASAAGVTPIISTLTPDSQPNIGGLKNIPNTYNPAITSMAQQKKVTVCDQYAALIGNWSSMTYDNLHPNSAGYQVMASTWYGTLSSVLPKKGSGGGGGCFIATAAYGSMEEPHVRMLREFRDRFLMTSVTGRALVDGYYRVSPPIAQVISGSTFLRSLVRVLLLPVIALAWGLVHFQVAGWFVAAGALFAMGLAWHCGRCFLQRERSGRR
jgi:lysophospholipase L1-like esterase